MVEQSLLKVARSKQEKVVDGLVEKSRPTSPYNLLLIFSAIIVSCGILMDNSPIIIGGMLVTPMLTPILAMVLGISTGELPLVNRSIKITLRSVLTVVVTAFILGFLFPEGMDSNQFISTVKPNILYVIVALISGAAATFAWTNDDINEALPGVAVAISIVPPLAVFGIGLSKFSPEMIRPSFVIFTLNFLGIIMGSLLVFSLQQFYKAKREAHKQVEEEIKFEEKNKREREKEKNGNK
ncbi:TIGR00341 family protein [Patescibacteria group bacterium]|nr:TIGR00341 family protein [Patescibacteria group bacterium]